MSETQISRITVDATKDNYLDGSDSSLDENRGAVTDLQLGFSEGLGPYRPVLFFPLPIGGELLSATIELTIENSSGGHIQCDGNPGTGCATVHVLTGDWGEGRGERGLCCGSAITNESSWIFDFFPSTWNRAGGDFEANPIGQRTLELRNGPGDIAEFALNVSRVQTLLNNRNYFGFLLRDDEDPGLVRVSSREGAAPPRLVLEFSGPPILTTNSPTKSPQTEAPIGFPTLVPTVRQTSATPVSPLPLLTDGVCGDYSQNLILNSRNRLTVEQIREFDNFFEEALESITPQYVPDDGIEVVTTAFMSPSQQSVDQSLGLDQDLNKVEMKYQLCFQVPLDSNLVDEVGEFSSLFLSYMNARDNRDAFEDRLINNGFEIVKGSLSPVIAVVSQPASASKSSTAPIAGGAVGGLLSVILVVGLAWLHYKRKRHDEDDDDDKNNEYSIDETIDRDNSRNKGTAQIPLAQAEVFPKSTGRNINTGTPRRDLGYKDLGQSVSAERSECRNKPRRKLGYKDLGQTVSEERTFRSTQ